MDELHGFERGINQVNVLVNTCLRSQKPDWRLSTDRTDSLSSNYRGHGSQTGIREVNVWLSLMTYNDKSGFHVRITHNYW